MLFKAAVAAVLCPALGAPHPRGRGEVVAVWEGKRGVVEEEEKGRGRGRPGEVGK
jgi:hypothetical protein